MKYAIAMISLAFVSAAQAAEPSWSDQPAWAAGGQDGVPIHRSSARERLRNVAPFSPGSSNLSVDVGQVFLVGGLAQYTDSLGAQLHYTYGVSDLFGFDCSAGYSSHSNDAFNMASLLPGIRINLAWFDKVIPYSIMGMGFYRYGYASAPLSTTGSSSSSSTPVASGQAVAPILFGVHFGAGLDLELTRQLFFGASLTVHDAFGGDQLTDNGKMVSVGGIYASFLVHAGVTF